MTHEKRRAINEIRRAIEHAMELGFTVVVASDPEGNAWHTVNPQHMAYDDSQEKYIAIGVWEHKEENEVFDLSEIENMSDEELLASLKKAETI